MTVKLKLWEVKLSLTSLNTVIINLALLQRCSCTASKLKIRAFELTRGPTTGYTAPKSVVFKRGQLQSAVYVQPSEPTSYAQPPACPSGLKTRASAAPSVGDQCKESGLLMVSISHEYRGLRGYLIYCLGNCVNRDLFTHCRRNTHIHMYVNIYIYVCTFIYTQV